MTEFKIAVGCLAFLVVAPYVDVLWSAATR